jgi:hypothetical protein
MKPHIQTQKATEINTRHRKEHCPHNNYLDFGKDRKNLIDCRVYFSPSSKSVYCCLWLIVPKSKKRPTGLYLSGSGVAGGGGYDKASTAAYSALTRAGVTLSQSIAGVGEEAIIEALLATAKEATGQRKFTYYIAHA